MTLVFCTVNGKRMMAKEQSSQTQEQIKKSNKCFGYSSVAVVTSNISFTSTFNFISDRLCSAPT